MLDLSKSRWEWDKEKQREVVGFQWVLGVNSHWISSMEIGSWWPSPLEGSQGDGEQDLLETLGFGRILEGVEGIGG